MPHDGTDKTANLPRDIAEGSAARRSPRLDEERYLEMIEDMDASEAQKRELLQTLWTIMVSIADLGLGLDPVHMLLNESSEMTSPDGDDPVDSSPNHTTSRFERATDPLSVDAPEES